MRTRRHDWFNVQTGRTLFGFQVFHHGKWRHAAEGGKPCIYKTAEERDAKRASFRSIKTGVRLAMPRDSYDTLTEERGLLLQQIAELQARLSTYEN